MNKMPKSAFTRQIIPKTIRKLKSPNISEIVRKIAPRTNRMIQSMETANVEHSFRIWNLILHESATRNQIKIINLPFESFRLYLFREDFHGYNIWNGTLSHTAENDNRSKAKHRYPFISWLLEPKDAISSEQEKASHRQ